MWRFRKYVRSKMNPIDPLTARNWKLRLSFTYAILAWNILALAVFVVVKDAVPRTKTNSVDYAKLLAVKDAKVVQFSNFSKSAEYDLKLSDKEIEEFYEK